MASRGKTAQPAQMFVLDLETCDSDIVDHKDFYGNRIYQQRVWLCGFKSLETYKTSTFKSLDQMMDVILSRGSNQNTEYAVHNLKFDGSFLVPWLLDHQFESVQQKPKEGQFSVLIDERNTWYSITVQVTKRRKVTFWDTLKLFPMALEYLHELYGTPTRKIHEDETFYQAQRPLEHVPTERELSYFENDLQVLAETLNAHLKLYQVRFKKTQASQSFFNFEKSFDRWKLRFPALDDDDDAEARKAYWGGIAHVAEQHKGKDCYHIGVFDINSSYPYQLATQKMPYGEICARYGSGMHPDMSKFWVAEALVEFKLKPYCVPCIPTKSVSEGRPITLDHWLTDSEGIVRMTFCNIDYVTIQSSYTFEVIHWVWSLHWPWKVQPEIASFVLTNNENKVKYKELTKSTDDPLQKLDYLTRSNRAKIDNNSFYGKFGEEIVKQGKTPYLENDQVIYRLDRHEIVPENKRRFLPLAIATTAWGRRQLVTLANRLGKNFIYCDTDSVHYLLKGHDALMKDHRDGLMNIHDSELGAWKFEGYYKFGRYLRPKCYMEETYDGKMEVTLAGLPADKHSGPRSKQRSCITKENFHIGLVIPGGNGKLRTIRTRTGNKLVPTDYQIDEFIPFMSL